MKHLLVLDLSKRYGNLINGMAYFNLGVSDVKKHRFLKSINFTNLLAKKISAPYKPTVKSENDVSNFGVFQDS